MPILTRVAQEYNGVICFSYDDQKLQKSHLIKRRHKLVGESGVKRTTHPNSLAGAAIEF